MRGAGALGRLVPLGGVRFPHLQNLILLQSVGSTNEFGRALVEKLLSEGEPILPTAIVARRQTSGRGRHGRSWKSPEGTLAVSLVLPWPEGDARVRLPLEMGVILARGLTRRFDVQVRLKWPNDLVVSRKKLGGLLIEARAGEEGEGYAVVGIGLNAGSSRADLSKAGLKGATSLRLSGAPADRLGGDTALLLLLSLLDEELAGSKPVLPRDFEAVSAHAPGDRLCVLEGERKLEGTYLGVTADGFLRLATGKGEETLVSGDICVF